MSAHRTFSIPARRDRGSSERVHGIGFLLHKRMRIFPTRTTEAPPEPKRQRTGRAYVLYSTECMQPPRAKTRVLGRLMHLYCGTAQPYTESLGRCVESHYLGLRHAAALSNWNMFFCIGGTSLGRSGLSCGAEHR